MTDEKKEKMQKKFLVVSEIPKQEVRTVKDEQGNEYEIMTVEEALTEIFKSIKKIEGSVA